MCSLQQGYTLTEGSFAIHCILLLLLFAGTKEYCSLYWDFVLKGFVM